MARGVVIKSAGSNYKVLSEDRTYHCIVKGRFRIKGIRTTNPVAVGDIVDFKIDDNHNTGLITAIDPRKNYIIRKSINLSHEAHIIAANVDQALLIVSLAVPETSMMFVDRFLVSAEAYRIPVRIVINKTDIYTTADLDWMQEWISLYEGVGYPVITTSAQLGQGMDTLKELMKDKTSVISGHSGVGKSTLINKADPTLNLQIGEISEYHLMGKHTTTYSEMFPLAFGGFIIDTPGIKGFGLIDIEREEMYHFFPEIFKHSKNCKYHNCLHDKEPHCAVKEAVENGEIHPSRYYNYLSLLNDKEEKYRTGY